MSDPIDTAALRAEVAEIVYRELGDMVNRDYLIDALMPALLDALDHQRKELAGLLDTIARVEALADELRLRSRNFAFAKRDAYEDADASIRAALAPSTPDPVAQEGL